jgi:hypothetical protein
MASTDILQPPRADGSARIAPARISRIPLSHQALSLGGWFLAVLSSELAIHGVGEPIRGAMLPLLIPEAAVAFLAGQRYWRTRLPRWLLASFAATSLTLNGVFSAFTDLGTTLHDVHQASDMAAIGTMFFLLVESFTPGVRASRIASLAGLLSCCGFVLVVPALLFGLGPAGLAQFLPLMIHEQSASVWRCRPGRRSWVFCLRWWDWPAAMCSSCRRRPRTHRLTRPGPRPVRRRHNPTRASSPGQWQA